MDKPSADECIVTMFAGGAKHYWDGDGWSRDPGKAFVYTADRARRVAAELAGSVECPEGRPS